MKHPLVVGYKGEIGSFILSGLLRVMPKAMDIWCVDINESEAEVEKRIRKSDVIFLCLPMDVTVTWLLYHRELLKKKVILEQCSLKEKLFDSGCCDGLDVRSMHILFRPSQTPNRDDRTVAFISGQMDIGLIDKIAEITESRWVLFDSIQEHDREMAVQQAMLHRIILVAGKMLRQGTPTFVGKKIIELEQRIKKGDRKMYGMIQDNRHVEDVLKRFKNEMAEFNIDRYL